MSILVDPTTITGNEVARYIRRRVCADCWGKLRYVPEIPGYTCDTPGCACRSSISERTVEIREADSDRLAHKAAAALAEVFGQPQRQTPDQAAILAELGF